MTPEQLDAMCAAALARIVNHVNRSAGQHLRAMRAAWAPKDQTSTKPEAA